MELVGLLRMNPMPLLLLIVAVAAAMLAGCAADRAVSQGAAVGADEAYPAGADRAAGADRSAGTGAGARGRLPAGAGPAASADQRTVYFPFDSAEILPEYRPVVESHARYLGRFPAAAVILEGHADERGTREYNVALGDRRADAVRQLMVALGAAPGQVRTVSYGEERPAVAGQDEPAYAKNRRVEITY